MKAVPQLDAVEWFRAGFRRRFGFLGPGAEVLYRGLFGGAEARFRRMLQSDASLTGVLRLLHVEAQVTPEHLDRIPRSGPVILVANHPYGEAEAPLLAASMAGIREDLKILGTPAAARIPPLKSLIIPIRATGCYGANAAGLREALRWLRSGGAILVFPAGATARRVLPRLALAEGPWTGVAARLAHWSGASVVPVFFHGASPWPVWAAGMVHPALRRLAVVWKIFGRRRIETIRLSIGAPLPPPKRREPEGFAAATGLYRAATLQLGDALPRHAPSTSDARLVFWR